MTIYKALLAAQAELSNPIKNAKNPHFKSKYATLPEIRDMVTPILAKHGLGIIQPIKGNMIETTLYHADTGEVITSQIPLTLEKQTSQGMGSAITYALRYSLCAILNIAADEDDDGNAASQPKAEPQKGMPGRMANDPDIQADLKANGYDSDAVFKTVMYELNACQDTEDLDNLVKLNKSTGRMKGLPDNLKDDFTTAYNTLKAHFADQGK